VQHYTAEATSADKAKIWQQRIFGTELNVKTKISLFYTCFGQAWFQTTHTHTRQGHEWMRSVLIM
jgi:hypothetical protein